MRRLLVLAALGAVVITARPYELQIYQIPNPMQDDWVIAPPPPGSATIHELGNAPAFPPDELIDSWTVGVDPYVPCPASDFPGVPNIRVAMVNLTGKAWDTVYYVADWGLTFVSNMDEFVGQAGTAPPWLAFKIDSLGENTPLVLESMIADNIWQPGERWEFILQDYWNSAGGLAHQFGSMGIAAGSVGDNIPGGVVSTGSILVPEPAWGFAGMALAGLVAVVILRRRS